MNGLRWTRCKSAVLAVAGTLALGVGPLGCAPGGGMPDPYPLASDRLVFQNWSPDRLRVSLYIAGTEILLGRVGANEQVAFRLRGLPPESDDVRLIVIRLGSPSATKPGPLGPGAISSDSYPVSELTRQMWRLAGSRVFVVPPSNRER